MESTSQETKTSSQPNQGTSLSALIDVIALQEQCFEQSLASQQLWSQKLADTQEAKIKAAVQKTAVCAAEVNEVLKGENTVASKVKTDELYSERGKKEWEPQLQPPSHQLSRSKLRSTSLFQHPEAYKEHRRYSPGDHVSERDLGNFNAYTHYDHYKDCRRSSYREDICLSGDSKRRLHANRRSSRTEGSWERARRSPSKSKPQRYCHEGSRSPRSGSFRCQYGDSRGRNYHRVHRSPVDDSIPHHRSIDSRKHRETRGASPLEIRRSHKNRDFWAEERNNDHGYYNDVKISEPTDRSSRFQSKQTMHGSSRNYATSETDGNGPGSMGKTEHSLHKADKYKHDSGNRLKGHGCEEKRN
ncbi:hypothetical protein DITRI_Ditri04bG0100800 [Diplodiscus trichospermus]